MITYTDAQTRKNYKRTALERSVEKKKKTKQTKNKQTKKKIGVCGEWVEEGCGVKGVGVVGLKPALIERNLTLNSAAAPNYKYIFGPHRVIYLICETSQRNTYNQKHWSQDTRKPQTGLRRATAIYNQAPTIWNRLRREPSFSLMTGPPSCK